MKDKSGWNLFAPHFINAYAARSRLKAPGTSGASRQLSRLKDLTRGVPPYKNLATQRCLVHFGAVI